MLWRNLIVDRYKMGKILTKAGRNKSVSMWLSEHGPRNLMVNHHFSASNGREVYEVYWLVVWNIFFFPYIGNNSPNWLIFFRGVETTNQFTFWLWRKSPITVLEELLIETWIFPVSCHFVTGQLHSEYPLNSLTRRCWNVGHLEVRGC